MLTFRIDALERAEIDAAARASGLTRGSYIRTALLKTMHTRTRRKPSIEVELLASLLGQVRKAGSNIYQILRQVHFGETLLGEELREAARRTDEAATAILEAMGRAKR